MIKTFITYIEELKRRLCPKLLNVLNLWFETLQRQPESVTEKSGHQHQYMRDSSTGPSSLASQNQNRSSKSRSKTHHRSPDKMQGVQSSGSLIKTSTTASTYTCPACGHAFRAQIRLFSHSRTHRNRLSNGNCRSLGRHQFLLDEQHKVDLVYSSRIHIPHPRFMVWYSIVMARSIFRMLNTRKCMK